jgi:predicted ATPase/DNA-binding CsgD family transcriptional regulator
LPARRLASSTSNLPLPFSPLIGRQNEIESVSALIQHDNARLITLTGPAGVGKTRLALGAAEASRGAFANGVYFVSLASITDPELVALTIAGAIGVREGGGASLVTRLAQWFGDRHALLVLDNFEQVVDAATLISTLLRTCPNLTVLVTSRVQLRISGEREHVVPPLAVESRRVIGCKSATPASDAVQLFVERARAVQELSELTAENAESVSAICKRVDGLPLAIELAAARTKMLSPSSLLSRLDRRLPLLTGGNRDMPLHQQTMRGTIDWSYELLSPDDQALFRRLSVFVGSFSLEAAESVSRTVDSDESEQVFERMASLIDNSLLQHALDVRTGSRYYMLETLREFGFEALQHTYEVATVRDRHADYFLALAEEASPDFIMTADTAWANRLAPDHENLRAAFDWLVLQRRAEQCLRLAAACAPFWYVRGYIRDGWKRLSQALEIAGPAPTVAKGIVLNWAGQFAITSGEYEAATALGTEGLAVWRLLDDPRGIARALHQAAMAEELQFHWEAAAALYHEELAVWRELGQLRNNGFVLSLLGGVAFGQGDLERACALELEASTVLEEAGDQRGVALSLWYLGLFSAAGGQLLDAAVSFRSSLISLVEHGDLVWVHKPLVGLAEVAVRTNAHVVAARLVGAVDIQLQQTGARLLPFDMPGYETAISDAQATLGSDSFAAAHLEGSRQSADEWLNDADAVVLAARELTHAEQPRATLSTDPLTNREREVLALLAEHLTDREIADRLFVSHRTVNSHVGSILNRLGVDSRREAIARAREIGLLPVAERASGKLDS